MSRLRFKFGLIVQLLGLGVGNLKDAFATKEGDKFGGEFVWDITLGIAIKLFAGD